MSLSTILLAVFFILWGLVQLGALAVAPAVLGIIALVIGILLLVDAWHPLIGR